MFSLNPGLLQKAQNLLLFTVFCLSISSSSLQNPVLTPIPGISLFIILNLLNSFIRTILKKRWSSGTEGLFTFSLSLLLSLLFIVFVRGLAFLTAGLSLPRDLLFIKFHAYFQLVLPGVMGAQILHYISLRSKSGHLTALVLNLLLFSLVMSPGGWSLGLPAGDLISSYLFVFFFLFLQVLLIFSGGRRGRRLALMPAILLFLVPLAGLLPLGYLYTNESRKDGGGLLESSLFRFDFSEYLSLENSISMKDDLVFLMKKEHLSERSLTRRFILSAYSAEKGFYRDPEAAPETADFLQNDYGLGEGARSWDYPDFKMRETVTQEYYLVNFDSSAFLGLNSPVSVIPFSAWDNSSFSRIYRVESRVSSAWGWDLYEVLSPIAGTEKEKEFLDYYTRGGDRDDLKQLALDITFREPSYYDKVESINNYLQENYFYSLNPGESATGDQLSHFLFESKKGYCSYFAFSMALLCRTVGIPARVSLGFWVDESSQVLNYYPVKANQAHAWVEVFFPGFGWIEFDPTSRTLAPGEEFSITAFSPQEMEPFLKEILENRDALKISVSPGPAAGTEEPSGLFRILRIKALSYGGTLLILVLSVYIIIRLVLLYRVLNKISNKKQAAVFFHIHLSLITFLIRQRTPGESIQDFAHNSKYTVPLLPGFVSHYEKIRFGRSSLYDLFLLKEKGQELRSALNKSDQKFQRLRFPRFLSRLLFQRWRSL